MRLELTEVVRIEEHHELTFTELAELSRLTEADLRELQECGVIAPVNPAAGTLSFAAESLVAARTAWRLREELELDAYGAAVALALLDRIRELEVEIRELKARSPSP